LGEIEAPSSPLSSSAQSPMPKENNISISSGQKESGKF